MKSFDINQVFTWTNANDAVSFVGRNGYFGDDLKTLQRHIDENHLTKLDGVRPVEECDISSVFETDDMNDEGIMAYGLFLPEDRVITTQPTVTYRPFADLRELYTTISHFSPDDHSIEINVINTIVHLKQTETSQFADFDERYETITGVYYKDDVVYIGIGQYYYTLQELFENYLVMINGEFVPMGIKIESFNTK